MKIGDKVRIIRRKQGNQTGVCNGYDKPNGNVGEIGIIVGITKNRLYRVDKLNDYIDYKYLGYFDNEEIELLDGIIKEPYYEIY
jgi:hypothetical protein